MKILKSSRKVGWPLDLSSGESGKRRGQQPLLPCHCTLHGSRLTANRKLCYVLQLMSLGIILCTLIVYQVAISKDAKDPSRLDGDEVLGNGFLDLNLGKVNLRIQPHQVGFSNSPGMSAIRKSKSGTGAELLDNVFLSVKSTKRFHVSRLGPVLKTWFNLAKDQTWIFTDDDDPELVENTNGHIINTHCPSTHYRQALCCKMGTEFDTFIQTDKSWFCHFDDDNYVNVPGLLDLLGKYNSRDYWYLGKPSLKSPIRIRDPDNHTEEVSFWFATGGAGFCLSRALALRMSPLASGGKFAKVCDRIQLPDDVTVGYIAGHLLGQNLTVIPQFHSHFETMKFIDMKNPGSEITFSYVRYAEYENILDVPEGLPEEDDPTRFLSLHCQLFPNFSFCPSSSTTTTVIQR